MLPASPTPRSSSTTATARLCHGAVKFVLKHDRSGKAFRFAPLQGATFQSRISAGARADLPDSIVVLTEDGKLLTRSNAFVHILRRLGGGWKILGGVARGDSAPVARRGL